jgi:hypothetical protein
VVPRKWIKRAQFLPPFAQPLFSIAKESANISADVWQTKNVEIEQTFNDKLILESENFILYLFTNDRVLHMIPISIIISRPMSS